MSARADLLNLCRRLRGEKLLVHAESASLQSLNGLVDSELVALQQREWLSLQQQLLVTRLIYGHPDATPDNSCRFMRELERTAFVEAYQKLPGPGASVTRLLVVLLGRGNLVGALLAGVEAAEGSGEALEALVTAVFGGLYGGCLFPEDERRVLDVLLHLLRLQLCPDPAPRRKIRKATCAFSRLYRQFSEGLVGAKLFLTAALHEPVMDLLSQDELFLDIDPSKAAFRFSPDDRRRKFGEEGSPGYKKAVEEHRRAIVDKLVRVTKNFIEGIRSAMPHFPVSLGRLIRELEAGLRAGGVGASEAWLISSDLVLTCFICPAIANPEPLGVIADTPISYIARFNLMQVGQILQTLAVCNFETMDHKLSHLYGRFEPDSVSGLVTSVLAGSDSAASASETGALRRNLVLLGLGEVDAVVAAARRLDAGAEDGAAELQGALAARGLPTASLLPSAALSADRRRDTSPANKRGSSPSSRLKGRTIGALLGGTREKKEEEEERAPAEVIIFRLDDATREPLGLVQEEAYLASLRSGSVSKEGALEKRARFLDSGSVGTSEALETEAGSDAEGGSLCSSLDQLLLLPGEEMPGSEAAARLPNGQPASIPDNFSDMVAMSANVSSGRASPNMSGRETPLSQTMAEAAAEEDVGDSTAAGKTGGDSEEEGDVPSTSGGVPVARRNLPHIPDTANKDNGSNREDLEEKFGKFGLPAVGPGPNRGHYRGGYGAYFDDTHSVVSDAWSTDVVASDTETGEGGNAHPGGIVPAGSLPDVVPPGGPPDMPRLDLIREEVQVTGGRGDGVGGAVGRGGGASASVQRDLLSAAMADDNKSDTWSVDALASDSEADTTGAGAEEAELEELEEAMAEQAAILSLQDEECRVRFLEPINNDAESVGASAAATDTQGPKGGLRRQSSGSSFYSQSAKSEADPQSELLEMEEPTFGDSSISLEAQNGSRVWRHGRSMTPQNPPIGAPGPEILGDVGRNRAGSDTASTKRPSAKKATRSDEKSSSPTKGMTPASSNPSTNSSEAGSINGPAKSIESWRAGGVIPKTKSSSLPANGPGKTRNPTPSTTSVKKTPETSGKKPSWAPMGTFATPAEKTTSSGGEKNSSASKSGSSRSKISLPDKVNKVKGLFKSPASPFNRPNPFKTSQTFTGSLNSAGDAVAPHLPAAESADDILKKYASLTPAAAEPSLATLITIDEPQPTAVAAVLPYYDPGNVSGCKAFLDAKRKLRLVLSSVDAASLPAFAGASGPDEELPTFLRLLLAEAIQGQDATLAEQLREVLRCLAVFEPKGLAKLTRALKEEQERRGAFLAYLQTSRLRLLQLQAYVQKLEKRIDRTASLSGQNLVEVLVRFFVEKRESELAAFLGEFRGLWMQDEKSDCVARFLGRLYLVLRSDPLWVDASAAQIEHAERSLERALMAQVYRTALFPNGEADRFRDDVLHEHVARLAASVTPSSPVLGIPPVLHGEAPWPSAQAYFRILNAYKSPRDKVACVVRGCETIENLLHMALGRPPAADDVTPVLVFVIIQANPTSLLSQLAYMGGFCGAQMTGEEAYRWTQFTSAVEYIKKLVSQ